MQNALSAAPTRRRNLPQGVENKPARLKMAPASVGFASASAAPLPGERHRR
jgi:hypothetical protein